MQVARMKKDATNESWLIYYLYMHNWRSTYIVTCSLHSFTSIWNLLWIFFNLQQWFIESALCSLVVPNVLRKGGWQHNRSVFWSPQIFIFSLGIFLQALGSQQLIPLAGFGCAESDSFWVLDGKHVFLALHGPRNGMNGVQRAHRILPMQTCSGQSEWCQQWIPRSSQPKLLDWWNTGKPSYSAWTTWSSWVVYEPDQRAAPSLENLW